jgi:dTDP-glucose 4,6-dehydratase
VLIKGTPGQIYNIGGGNELPNLDIVKRLVTLAKRDESYIEFVTDRRGHDQRYSVDDRKIRSELGYAPKVNFKSELALVFEWYKRVLNFS